MIWLRLFLEFFLFVHSSFKNLTYIDTCLIASSKGKLIWTDLNNSSISCILIFLSLLMGFWGLDKALGNGASLGTVGNETLSCSCLFWYSQPLLNVRISLCPWWSWEISPHFPFIYLMGWLDEDSSYLPLTILANCTSQFFNKFRA